MDFFVGTKKRLLLIAVRSFLGRFFKEIGHSQLDEPVIHARSIGLSFRLINLELNTELFNTQILQDTPFRLISGTINEISGTVSMGNVDGRSLEVEGIELILRLMTPQERCAHAERDCPQPARSQDMGEDEMYYSMLTGPIPLHDLVEEPVPALPDLGTHDADQPYADSVNSGLDALASTIKDFVLSLRGKIRHVTIRIRVPPSSTPKSKETDEEQPDDQADDSGDDNGDGNESAPDGEGDARVTHEEIDGSELLIHLQGEVELRDETQPMSYGNSFRKRIRFAGIRVCVYDALVSEETDDRCDRNIKLEDTILSGDLGSMENEISIQYVDVDRSVRASADGAAPQPTWKTKVSIKQVHALLSPNQLARASMILNALCLSGPQKSQGQSGSSAQPSKVESTEGQSRFTVQFDQLSCCMLVSEEVEAMRDAWAHVGQVAIAERLEVPHYGICTGGLTFQVRSGSIDVDHTRDPLWKLYNLFGSQFVTLKVDNVEVLERRPNVEPTVIIRVAHTSTSDGASASAAPPVRTSAPLRMVIRNAFPITEEDLKDADGGDILNPCLLKFAQRKNLLPPSNPRRPIICQNTSITVADIELHADVEMLDRLLEFYNIVDAHLFRVTHASHNSRAVRTPSSHEPRRASTGASSGGSSSPFKDDLFADDRRPFVRLDAASLTAPQHPGRRATGGHRMRAPAPRLLPATLAGLSFEANSVAVHLSFPLDRTPNVDLYGPLTQRLFNELVKLAQPRAAPASPQGDPHAPSDDIFSHHRDGSLPPVQASELVLSKSLEVKISDVQLLLPVGTTELAIANVRSANCALVDTFEGSRTEIIHAEFATMDASDIAGVYGPAMDAWLSSDDMLVWNSTSSSEPVPTNGSTRTSVSSRTGASTLNSARMSGAPPAVDPRSVCGGPSLLLRVKSANLAPGTTKQMEQAWSHVDALGPHSAPDAYMEHENQLLNLPPIACALRISELTATMHQDELLLFTFLVNQIVECISVAMETHEELLHHISSEGDHASSAVEADAEPSRNDSPPPPQSSAPPSISTRNVSEVSAGYRHSEGGMLASSLFHTPRSARTDVPASYIREQVLQKSRNLTTSILNHKNSVWGKSVLDKSALFHSARSNTSSEGSCSLWGSHQRIRDEEGSPIAVHVHVDCAWVTLFAPRLTPGGTPVGEPLHMLLPLTERYNEQAHPGQWLYHTYSIEARRVAAMVTTNTVQSRTSMEMNIRLERVELAERLCPVPPATRLPPTCDCQPPWGGVQLLLQGYNDTYNKSHRVAEIKARQTLLVRLSKVCDMDKRLQTMNVGLNVDRCCLYHQPAHEGDHWLFVLMNFVGDSPVASSSAADDGSPTLGAENNLLQKVCPLSFSTSVKLLSNDFLVQYRPLGRSSVVLVLVPSFSLRVGPITVDPSVHIGIQFDKISILVHNHFPDDVLAPDGHRMARGGARAPHTFGSTRRGVSGDLEALGFVQVLCAGSLPNKKDTDVITIRIRDHPEKPVFVQVSHVKVELSCAYDSFYYFQIIQSHFGGGADQVHIPKPYAFASAYSPRYLPTGAASSGSEGHPAKSLHGAPLVIKYSSDAAEKIASLLRHRLEAAVPSAPATPSVAAVPSSAAQPSPLPHTSAAADFDDEFDTAARRITESELDDFVDAGDEIEAVRKSEVEAQKMPFWDIVDDGEVVRQGSESLRRHADPLASSRSSGTSPRPSAPAVPMGSTVRDTGIAGRSVRRYFSANRVLPNYHNTQDPLMNPRRLVNAPPIGVEVIVSNCHADVKLFGGSDFGLGFFAVREDTFTETFAFFHRSQDAFGGVSHADLSREEQERRAKVAPFELSLASHPPGRRVHESVQLALRHIFVQVDIFEPGHEQSMQLLTCVREIEVRDAIYGSPVQTILMCSIPRELRDQDGWAFEMKWITRTPLGPSLGHSATGKHGAGGAGRAEEDISIRLQPMVLTVHRKVIDVIMPFIDLPEIESPPSNMFFRRVVVHPLRLRLNVLFEVENYKALFEGETIELANLLPCVQDSRVWMPLLVMESFPVEDFAVRIADAMQEQLGMEAIWMLLCGIQPIRAVAEATSAAAGLVLMPLDDYKRNKNLYRGILKGISHFSRRIGGETLGIVGGAARSAHETLHMATTTVRQQQTLSRGNQPRNFVEGVYRGASEIADGLRGVGDIMRYCLSEDGSIAQLPLAAVAPVDGLMRGLTQMFTGARNAFRPDTQMMEGKIFKQ